MPEGSTPRLWLTVQRVSRSNPLPSDTQLRLWMRRGLERSARVTLRIVDRHEGQILNRDYRGKDYPTNVLTFPYETPPGSARLNGDIVLCAPVVRMEALSQKKPLWDHYAHLVIHGILHLQGYDHEEESDAILMEDMEIRYLASLNIPNPYTECAP
ncbi:MAG: rRNA maturation RNase YbeY [Ferrovum sp.]|nr:rRNA maturation RNase YbeY [Ferrovum sp.]NDU87021.1 rRNA maturation RNase YbeY [Ferrovum sp.]